MMLGSSASPGKIANSVAPESTFICQGAVNSYCCMWAVNRARATSA